jgi:hypothetical protein
LFHTHISDVRRLSRVCVVCARSRRSRRVNSNTMSYSCCDRSTCTTLETLEPAERETGDHDLQAEKRNGLAGQNITNTFQPSNHCVGLAAKTREIRTESPSTIPMHTLVYRLSCGLPRPPRRQALLPGEAQVGTRCQILDVISHRS